ncbi:MAG: hypothetical protein WCF78_02765 [archaeon]
MNNNPYNSRKGIIFTIDGLLALTFIGIFIIVLGSQANTNEIEKYQINKLIGDLLITSQEFSIDNTIDLEINYHKLFGEKKGYIIVNTNKIEINKEDDTKTKLITQRINYINISNYEIYIEVGVYY